MRLQASITVIASGVVGMYTATRSPRRTPSPRSAAAARFTSSRSWA